MAIYSIRWRASARRDFARLPAPIKNRVGSAVNALAQQPRPPGALLLSGTSSPTWRIRIGDYRVLYEIQDDILLVLVVGVGHRRDIYRGSRISESGVPYEAATESRWPHGGRSWTSDALSRLG